MVHFGFYAWALVAILMLVLVLKHHTNPQQTIFKYLAFCGLWVGYIAIISSLGLLDNFGLPPRVPLLIVIPITVLMVWMINQKTFETILENTPLHLPVFLQSFRIVVELLIFGAYLNGIFPKRATFEGLNFDILVGISALFVGVLTWKSKISLLGMLVWNIVSLMILSVTVYSFISTYYFMNASNILANTDFVRFPYVLLASVLLPVAIFLHAFSLKQILAKIKVAKWATS